MNMHTWTGWGSVTYWNAFVANLEMHGKGTFYDPRLNAGADGGTPQFPIAVKAGIRQCSQHARSHYAQAGEPPSLPACHPGTHTARR